MQDGGPVFLVYKRRLEQIFKEYAPVKVAKIPELLRKYDGREHELYTKACQKYGVEAEPIYTAGAKSVEDVYRERITNIYKQRDSTKLDKVQKHLTKYKGREHEIYVKLCQRYKIQPEPAYSGQGDVLQPRGKQLGLGRRLSQASESAKQRRRSSLITRENRHQFSSGEMAKSRQQMEQELSKLHEEASDDDSPNIPSRRRTITEEQSGDQALQDMLEASSAPPATRVASRAASPKPGFSEWKTGEMEHLAASMKDELNKMAPGGHHRGMSAMQGELNDINNAASFLATLNTHGTPTAGRGERMNSPTIPEAPSEEDGSSASEMSGDADDQENQEELIYHFESKLMKQLKKIQKYLTSKNKDKKWKQMPSPIDVEVKQHVLGWKQLVLKLEGKIEMLTEGKAEQALLFEQMQEEQARMQRDHIGAAASNVEIDMMQQQLEKAKERIAEAEEEIDEAENKEEALATQIEELKSQIDTLESGDDAAAEFRQDLEEANAARARLKKAMDDLNEAREEDKNDWDEEQEKLETIIEQTNQQIQQLQEANQQFTLQGQQLKNEQQQMQDQLVHVSTEKHDIEEKLAEAKEELASLRPSVAQFEKESEMLHQQVDTMTSAQKHNTTKLEKQAGTLAERQAEIARLKGDLRLAEHKLDTAVSSSATGADTRLVELNARIKELENRKRELEDSLGEAQRQAQDAAMRTGSLEGELKGAQREVEALQRQMENNREMYEESKRMHQDSREDVQKQVTMAKDQINDLQADNKKVTATRDTLRSEVEGLKAMSSGDGNAAKHEMERLQGLLGTATQRSADLTNSLDEQRTLVEDLKTASSQGRQDQQNTIQMLREQIEQLQGQTERLEGNSRDRFQHNEEVQEALTKARAENEQLLQRVRKSEDEISDKDKEMRELSERAGEVNGLRGQLRDKTHQLETQAEQTKQKDQIMQTIQATLDEQRSSISRLEREKEEFKSENKTYKKMKGAGDSEELRNMLHQKDSRVEELSQELAAQRAQMDHISSQSRDADDARIKMEDDFENAISSKLRLILDTSEEIERLKNIINREVIRNFQLQNAKAAESSDGPKVDDWSHGGSDDIVYGGL